MEQHYQAAYNELVYYTLNLEDDFFIHQYLVDAYTAQTAIPQTKSISLAFALAGLYLCVELQYTGKQVQAFHTLMSNHKMSWPTFTLPQKRGSINAATVLQANTNETKNELIKSWCTSVWAAYSVHHTAVKELVEYYLGIEGGVIIKMCNGLRIENN
jgi:hypothetical protein